MKIFTKSVVATALIMSSTAAMADVSGNVALTSNYVFRGLTQTMNDGAIQGGLDYSHESGLYAGVWGSNVEFGDTTSMELDLYVGYAGDMGNGISYDVGVLRYAYDDEDYDTNELYIGLGYDFSETVSGAVNYAYSSDWFDSGDSAWYLSAGVDVALPQDFGASFSVGKSDGEAYEADSSDYVDYKLGLTKSFSGVDFEVSYTDTNLDSGADNDDDEGRFMLTVSKSL